MTNIPIFLSSDNGYAPFVATTIASICGNTESFCEFYVLDGGISKKNQEKICKLNSLFNNFSIEFIKIDVDKYFKNFANCLHYTKTMYARFLIPQIKPNLNKVLYSDVDVIALGDIKEMWNEDLENYILGAVPETYLHKDIQQVTKNRLGISQQHELFSSGNLIINCSEWRNLNITESLINIEKNNSEILSCPDQEILNMYFDNNYKKLPVKYCCTIQHDACGYQGSVLIRHFNGKIKPWNINKNSDTKLMPNLKDFWYYAEKTPFYNELENDTKDESEQKIILDELNNFRILSNLHYNNDKIGEEAFNKKLFIKSLRDKVKMQVKTK